MTRPEPYDSEYFARYETRGRFFRRGERPWLYGYWRRRLLKLLGEGDQIVLEVGCGGGYALNALATSFGCVGVDISGSALATARARLGPAVPLIQASATELPIATGSARGVLAFDVLEHLQDPDEALREIRRILVPGAGILVVTVPNPDSLGMRIKNRTWYAARHDPSPLRDSTHASVLRRQEWKSLFSASGLEVVAEGTDGLWDAPYLRWVPMALQKLIFGYPSALFAATVGYARWSLGENQVFVLRSVKHPPPVPAQELC